MQRRKSMAVEGPDAATRMLRQLQEIDSRIAELARDVDEHESSSSTCSGTPDESNLAANPTMFEDGSYDQLSPYVQGGTGNYSPNHTAHTPPMTGTPSIAALPGPMSAAGSHTHNHHHHHHRVQSFQVLHHALGEELCTVEMCHYAAAGDLAPLDAILRAGFSPNRKDYDENTPLHVAAAHGQLEAAQLLLQHHADVQQVNQAGLTALELAQERGHTTIYEMLLEYKAAQTGGPLRKHSSSDLPDSYDRGGDGHSNSLGNNSFSYGQSLDATGRGLLSREWPLGSSTGAGDGHVLVMVGLPARGKSFMARRISRYWRWRGVPCRSFHFGRVRAEMFGQFDRAEGQGSHGEVEQVARRLASEAAEFAVASGGIALVDGTNTVASRRAYLRAFLMERGIASNHIIFIELVRDSVRVVHANVLRSFEAEVANGKSEDTPEAKRSFVENYYKIVRQHERVARPLSVKDDPEYSFVRIVNHNHLTLNRIDGVLATRLVYLLHNLWYEPHRLYFTVTGEWRDLAAGKLGGNSTLTHRGATYAAALGEFLVKEAAAKRAQREAMQRQQDSNSDDQLLPPGVQADCRSDVPQISPTVAHPTRDGSEGPPFVVMSSAQERGRRTCQILKQTPGLEKAVFRYLPTLNDLAYGECEEQTPEQIRATLPNTLKTILADPYNNAWPNGESIKILFESRLEQHIHEIHSIDRDVVIVAAKPVIQGLLYFFNEQHDVTDPSAALDFDVPLHKVMRLSPKGSTRVLDVIDLHVPVSQPGDLSTTASTAASPAGATTGVTTAAGTLKAGGAPSPLSSVGSAMPP